MPRLSFLLVLLLGILLPSSTMALYSARSDVVQLTEENFKVMSRETGNRMSWGSNERRK